MEEEEGNIESDLVKYANRKGCSSNNGAPPSVSSAPLPFENAHPPSDNRA